MNNTGYQIYYGGANIDGEANPYSWEACVKVIKYHKRNKGISYILCVGPYGGGRRLIYRAMRGRGWSAAMKNRPGLMNVPMNPVMQIESD
jgi:hypothetical protein